MILRGLSGALCCAVAIGMCCATPSAQLAGADAATTPAITWNQLGLSSRIELVGANQPADVSVPVPQGVAPAELAGEIGSAVNATGRVDVLDARGIVLGSVPIPVDAASVPFVLDVSSATVAAGVAKLTFMLRSDKNAIDNACSQPPAVILSQLATSYSGPTPHPRSIADFLPSYLSRITIWIGEDPTVDQQQAALSLVAKLTHLYRPMPVRIDVDTAPEPTPAPDDGTGAQRVIAIRADGPPGFVVENPDSPEAILSIAGSGPELLRQVQLFADRRFDLAQTPYALVTSTDGVPERSAAAPDPPDIPTSTDTLSFGELGMTAHASIVGTSTLYIGFDAAAFAVGSIDSAKIHLIAHYTPVTTGDASIVLRSGDVTLASQVLDKSGVVDLTGEIPAGPIGSNVGLALEVRYIPRQECAAPYDRLAFSVDPASTVTVSQGNHHRGGFPVLPMAFTPAFDVAIDVPDQIRWVAQAINLMAQQSTVVLQPNMTTLDQAAKRGSGLLVVATGDELARAGMRPPLLLKSDNAVEVQGIPVTGIDLNGPVGVIQAFSNNGRMVLAIGTSGDGALVDADLDYIRALDSRWATLTGDVVATGAAGTTVNLVVRDGGPMAHQPLPGDEWRWWTWFTLALGAVTALAVPAVLITRRRRRTRRHGKR